MQIATHSKDELCTRSQQIFHGNRASILLVGEVFYTTWRNRFRSILLCFSIQLHWKEQYLGNLETPVLWVSKLNLEELNSN